MSGSGQAAARPDQPLLPDGHDGRGINDANGKSLCCARCSTGRVFIALIIMGAAANVYLVMNLAQYGWWIGHEMTHAFDNHGRFITTTKYNY